MMSRSASLQNRPANSVTSSGNVPSGPEELEEAHPLSPCRRGSRPRRRPEPSGRAPNRCRATRNPHRRPATQGRLRARRTGTAARSASPRAPRLCASRRPWLRRRRPSTFPTSASASIETFAVFELECRVVGLRVDGESDVGRQRPRSRGPREERRIALRPATGKTNHHRGVVDGLVALADLAGRERGAALRPPPDDLVALVEQALSRTSPRAPTKHSRRTTCGRSRRRSRSRPRSRCAPSSSATR